MHELGLCEAILDAVERRAAGRKVTWVRVRVGEAHAADADAMSQWFEIAATGGVAEGAVVEMVAVPGAELVLEAVRLAAGPVPEPADEGGRHVPGHPR